MFVGNSLRCDESINGLQTVLHWQESTVYYCVMSVHQHSVFAGSEICPALISGEKLIQLEFCTQVQIFYLHCFFVFLVNMLSILHMQHWSMLGFSGWHLAVINILVFICRFHAQDLEVKLSDELAGSLRQLKVLNKLHFSYSVWPFRSEKMQSFICNESFGSFILSTVLGSF